MFKATFRIITIIFMSISLLPVMLIGFIGFEYLMAKYQNMLPINNTVISKLITNQLNNTVLCFLCMFILVAFSFGIVCISMDLKFFHDKENKTSHPEQI